MEEEKFSYITERTFLFHRALAAIIAAISFQSDWIENAGDLIYLVPAFAMLLVVLTDFILVRLNNKNSKNFRRVTRVFRYIQILVCLYFVMQSTGMIHFAMAIFCFMLFSFEMFFTFDYLDRMQRVTCHLMIGIPYVGLALIRMMNGSRTQIRGLSYFLVFFALIMFQVVAGIVIAGLSSRAEKLLFEQMNLLENARKDNEKICESQKKLQETMEMLGVKKIQVETMNRQMNKVNKEMMAQNDILKYISSSLEIEELMKMITETIIREVGVSFCGINLTLKDIRLKKNQKPYRISYKDAVPQEIKDSIENAFKSGQFERYLKDRDEYLDNDMDGNSGYPFYVGDEPGSILLIPLVKAEERIGLFVAGDFSKGYFEENTSFYQGIMTQLIIAIDNARLYMKMQNMAIRDGLTGIFNRRHLTERFNEMMNEAILKKQSMSVALFDIDHFKNVNDTYGHLCGDEVIKCIASLAAEIAEDNDGIVGRYGGEEFVIIFPQMNVEEALIPVKKMQEMVRKSEIEHGGKIVSVRVSVGLTSYPETCPNPGELLNSADWAMYYSKQHGRDRITIDSDEVRNEVKLTR